MQGSRMKSSGSPLREQTRILVVADGLNRALFGVQKLLRQDREITFTFTRKEAIRILKGGSFDFLLADSHLNEGSGQDVFQAGRSRNGQLQCLVVDLSKSAGLAMNAVEAMIRGDRTTADLLPEAA